jgi:putative peptidoglycan lipid II flippase
VAPGFEGELRDLTVHLVQILFPGVGLLVLSAWCLGVLNSHRKFFLSYVAPVFWNLAMITTLVVCGQAAWARNDLAVALAWGTVLGSGLQFGMQLPFVFKHSRQLRFGFDTQSAPVQEVFKNLGPVVLSRGVVQLSAYIDGMIASFLGAAAVSGLGYAQTLYLLPVSLFGMSVAAAELPEMSSAQGSTEEIHAQLRNRLAGSQRRIAFFVIPSVIGFLFLGRTLVAALFQSGSFGDQDSLYVWYILIGSTVGLLAATWGRLYSSAFYALRDTRTPLRFAVIRVVLTAVLGGLFAFPLRPFISTFLYEILQLPSAAAAGGGEVGLGAVGLTASAGIAGWVEFFLLKRALQAKVGEVQLPRLLLVQLWGAALLSGGAGWASLHALGLPLLANTGSLQHILEAIWAVASFGVVYLGLAALMGFPEVMQIVKRLRRR